MGGEYVSEFLLSKTNGCDRFLNLFVASRPPLRYLHNNCFPDHHTLRTPLPRPVDYYHLPSLFPTTPYPPPPHNVYRRTIYIRLPLFGSWLQPYIILCIYIYIYRNNIIYHYKRRFHRGNTRPLLPTARQMNILI